MAKRFAKTVKKILTGSISAGQRHDVKERAAPAPATSVKLPLCPPREVLGFAAHTAQEISELFLKIHRTGPSIQHVQALNVCSVAEVALEQLVPNDHLPPTSWQQDPSTTGGSSVFPAPLPSTLTLSNGSPIPDHDVYFNRAKELLFDNEDAFRSIERKPILPGRPTIRVAHFRKFWDGLSQMADYWDTSLDEYTGGTADTNQVAMDTDQLRSDANSTEGGDADRGTKKRNYTGRRLGTGKEMPPRHRDDAVFAFVEAIASAFRCKTEKPRMEPKIKLHNLFIPLPQIGNVYRYPKDSQQARRGVLEGPLMGIQCTNHTVFHRPEEAPGEGQGESANLLREIGVMLSIAHKRSREGQTEPDPSEGKWWVSKPRWGGGAGGEVGVSEESQDAKEVEPKSAFVEEPVDESKKSASEPRPPIRFRGGIDRLSRKQEPGSTKEDSEGSAKGRKRTKRSSAVENWKNLQPAQSTWDKNVVYKQIGKQKNATFDDVSVHFQRGGCNSLNSQTDLSRLRSLSPHFHCSSQCASSVPRIHQHHHSPPQLHSWPAAVVCPRRDALPMVRPLDQGRSQAGHERRMGRHLLPHAGFGNRRFLRSEEEASVGECEQTNLPVYVNLSPEEMMRELRLAFISLGKKLIHSGSGEDSPK